jgi:hypothetical protein
VRHPRTARVSVITAVSTIRSKVSKYLSERRVYEAPEAPSGIRTACSDIRLAPTPNHSAQRRGMTGD